MKSNFLIEHDFDFSPSPSQDMAQSQQLQMGGLFNNSQGVTNPMLKQFEQYGIDHTGIGFNPTGKMQLLSRMEQNKNLQPNDIKKLLSMFDSEMQNQNIDSQRDYTDTVTRAQKSLEALYRG